MVNAKKHEISNGPSQRQQSELNHKLEESMQCEPIRCCSPSWKGDILEKPSLHPDSDHARITCYDPSTGYRLAVLPSPTPQDMHDLVTRAEAASKSWRNSTFAQRRQVLRSLLAFCIREKQSIAEICCRDTGKTSKRVGRLYAITGVVVFLTSEIAHSARCGSWRDSYYL
jgi:hypothetical protein